MGKIKVSHDYPFTNDYMFSTVMKDPEYCKELLNRILPDRKVDSVKVLSLMEKQGASSDTEKAQTQRVLNYEGISKGVRLDVTFEDDEAVYNIEMQVESEPDLPHRIRYYSDQLDLELLPKGASFSDLKTAYVIFICKFDYMKQGHLFYTFENYDIKNRLKLGDGRYTIIVNTKGSEPEISDKMQNLLDYINDNVVDSSDEFLNSLDREISWLNREDGEWRRSIMKLEDKINEKVREARESGFNEGRDSGFNEGRDSGFNEALVEVAFKMKSEGATDEAIKNLTGISPEEIEEM